MVSGSHGSRSGHLPEVVIPFWTAVATYFGYGLLIFLGHIRDFFDRRFKKQAKTTEMGYAPIVSDFEDFYTRRLYHRYKDCWNRPVTSCAGATIDVVEREVRYTSEKLKPTGVIRSCLNLGSYNYLGFGDPSSPTKPHVLNALAQFGCSTCSARTSLGTTSLHALAEVKVAEYVRKEAAIVFGMGFATNSTVIPTIIGSGDLVISDSANHASIAVGCRSSGATIRVFAHNSISSLESVVRNAIISGQPLSHRPWKKILIMVEGIYSMEGEVCPLAEIVAVKKKYKCYLYVDEAHSIGAIGETGRGICEYAGVNPDDVDILMGTFTKSFGAVGGYIASSKNVIQHIRHACSASIASSSISPPAMQQVISAFRIMTGEDGTTLGQVKLRSLHDNANYFRQKCMDMGLHVLGNWDSPVVPVLLYHPSKIAGFSRLCFNLGLAVVVVGFPASPLMLSRTRFCISAAHTREQLDDALTKIEGVCEVMGLKYNKPIWKLLLPTTNYALNG